MRRVRSAAAVAAIIAVLMVDAEAGTITGTVATKGSKGAGNAVVYVDVIPGVKFAAPEAHAVIDQRDMKFSPAVLPVLAGTTVDFRNSDEVLHNVFTPLKCAGSFNLGTWAKGEHRSHTFSEAGCAAILLCSAHPEMQGYVLTVPTPYFATTGTDGVYSISDVPPGTYSVKVWHGRLRKAQPETVEVTVAEETPGRADFALKK